MSIAMTDEETVVQSRLAMPNRGLSPATVHSVDVRKLALSRASDGIAWERRKTAISVTIAITRQTGAGRRATEEPGRRAVRWRRGRLPPAGLSVRAGLGVWSTAEAPVTLDMSAQLDRVRRGR